MCLIAIWFHPIFTHFHARLAGGFPGKSASTFFGALALVAAGLGLFSWSGDVSAPAAGAACSACGGKDAGDDAGYSVDMGLPRHAPPRGYSSNGSLDDSRWYRASLSSGGSPAAADPVGRETYRWEEAGLGGPAGWCRHAGSPQWQPQQQMRIAEQSDDSNRQGNELQPLWSRYVRP